MKNNLGLESNVELMIFALNECEYVEYLCSKKVLEKLEISYAEENNIPRKKVKTQFINYGNDLMVYVLKSPNNMQTVLMGLPTLEFGRLKKEADLLYHFHQIDNTIIAPTEYRAMEAGRFKREFMLTPYIYQARCISNFKENFGLYIPEPKYRFVPTNEKQTSVIKTCIIAKLISSFDTKNNLGISKVEVIGGDFILPKGWEKQEPTYENTLNDLKLISIRDSINCSLDEYIDLVKKEFPLKTKIPDNYKANNNYILNTCSEIPFTEQEINKGIELGLEQKQQRQNNSEKIM